MLGGILGLMFPAMFSKLHSVLSYTEHSEVCVPEIKGRSLAGILVCGIGQTIQKVALKLGQGC